MTAATGLRLICTWADYTGTENELWHLGHARFGATLWPTSNGGAWVHGVTINGDQPGQWWTLDKGRYFPTIDEARRHIEESSNYTIAAALTSR